MEPIPETLRAIADLDAYDDTDVLQQLRDMADRAREVAPALVGMSVASRVHGVTFTLVATDDEIAALDGIQYVTGGPCVASLDQEQGLATGSDDLFSEARWQLFASASAAAGICSTLTLPVVEDTRVVGTVNLYGATDDAFHERHAALAEVFGAWAAGVVVNADLSFMTREAAVLAPEQLRAEIMVDTAVGIVAAERGVDVDTAASYLSEAARRAGVPLGVLARAIVERRAPGTDG